MGLGSTEGEECPTVGRTQLGLWGHSFESVQRLGKNRGWRLVCISYRKKGRDPEGPLDRRAAFCPQIACCGTKGPRTSLGTSRGRAWPGIGTDLAQRWMGPNIALYYYCAQRAITG